jgi:hypothetical protein
VAGVEDVELLVEVGQEGPRAAHARERGNAVDEAPLVDAERAKDVADELRNALRPSPASARDGDVRDPASEPDERKPDTGRPCEATDLRFELRRTVGVLDRPDVERPIGGPCRERERECGGNGRDALDAHRGTDEICLGHGVDEFGSPDRHGERRLHEEPCRPRPCVGSVPVPVPACSRWSRDADGEAAAAADPLGHHVIGRGEHDLPTSRLEERR